MNRLKKLWSYVWPVLLFVTLTLPLVLLFTLHRLETARLFDDIRESRLRSQHIRSYFEGWKAGYEAGAQKSWDRFHSLHWGDGLDVLSVPFDAEGGG